ncbi:hypothetical protein TRFO_26015 [Tritrichomonas foetus]|uniref:Conserved oligomeric Golgi complex subunit 4 n=1 Tax=Tritrichomonas foetus TaxID=1144522 RepID=A0A1J4K4H3_9EUKA|nr:hypothetical protein TRFO_26015 [Tritrichomonas foetus]|eukprot:OHT06091.1 hypothetical protein TRFO_26015 [Tritrichomonas foetus]
MDLEARRQQLLSRMNALKQQEQAIESFMASNEKEQLEAIDLFKNGLNSALSSLTDIPANFAVASKQIDSVFSLASDLSFRIKEVDTAISRCTHTADYIRHFADLHECLGSIDKFFEQKNIPKICDSINRLIQIPDTLLTPDDSKKIDDAKKNALLLLQEEFENSPDPIQIFQYYSQIDSHIEGIIQFANVHYKTILDEINDDRINIIQLPPASPTDDTRAPHVEVYVKLLNCISSHILSSILPLSDPGQFSVFIRILLERVDNKIEEIITKYSEYRKLSDLETQSSSEMKLAVVDLVNDEISIFAHQFALFENFIGQKLSKGLDSQLFKEYKFAYPTTANTGLPKNTLAVRAIQVILAQYSVLTQSYIMSVTSKLLKTVSLMDKTADVTDAIDDLFFVFQRTLNRSITTHSASTTCTIFNVITSIIRDNLMQSIRSKKRFKSVDVKGKYGVHLNAFEVVGVYLNKLTALIETTITKQFSSDDLIAIQMGLQDLKTCGNQLEEELTNQFDEMTRMLTPSAQKLCDPFNVTIWMGSISVELETHLQKEFKMLFMSAFADYKYNLNASNYSHLMKRLAKYFVNRLEGVFMLKQFDSSGAVLMSRMVKWVSQYFGNPPSFRKLKDMARVLTLSSPEQLRNIWGARATDEDPVQFDLTELKKIVKLRIEWRENDLGFLIEA